MKPILFNTDMVQAILDGRKTVTRRLMKPQLPINILEIDEIDPLGYLYYRVNERYIGGCRNCKSPYKLGDILYVRETWLNADDGIHYKANTSHEGDIIRKEYGYKWRPSIHMPKEIARIFLKITSAKADRLQNVTVGGAIHEGTPYDLAFECNHWHPTFYDPDSGGDPEWIEAFKEIWNSTIKKSDIDHFGWDANPWVWVIEFERIDNPELLQEVDK